jgi:NAD(P)-dependent dehydrogenase (short-subunit alcohol dehydrogenase family)
MKDLSGRVAFVTGGASGMGLAMVRAFTAAGMKVAIADIETQALDAAMQELAASNAQVIALPVDVTDRDAMEAAAEETVRVFGKVHVVCNNAGVAVGGPVDDMSFRDWDWVLSVNIDGVVNGVQSFVNRIKSHGEGGHFVNTASMAGHIGVPGLSVYNTSKFAVVGLSEAMRLDLAPHGIGVSVLCPGVVRTNIFNSGRNRPTHLSTATDTASAVMTSELPPEHRSARIEELLANALEPAVVGEMVLHAVQTDEFYIFTHPEIQQFTAARADEIDRAFRRWASYRSNHGVSA